jgi:hypothetical protein
MTNKPTNGKRLTLPQRTFRTATGAGHRILDGVDGRCSVARRYGEVAASIASDLGGEDHLTELQTHLIRSVAGLVVLRERLDAKVINGEAVNSAVYCRIANSTRRVAVSLGLRRTARDVTPDLDTYIAARRGRREDVEDAEEAEGDD